MKCSILAYIPANSSNCVCQYHLNDTVCDHARNKVEEKGGIVNTKKKREEVEYAVKCYKAHCAKL